MAVHKQVRRNLLDVKLAQLDLLEPSGDVAKSIYSVGTPGDPIGIRYFPYLADAEIYFFEQVRKVQGGERGGHRESDVPAARIRSIRGR
jgi:hypothetical protein